jgi:hypothetical protein
VAINAHHTGTQDTGSKHDVMQTDSRDIADLNIIRSIALLKRAVCLQHTRSMMGPYIDIPGPEISAGSRMMSWFFDEYSKYKRFSPACVTGKVCA